MAATLREVADLTVLDECIHLRSGKTPSRGRSDFWSGDIPWFSAKDLKSFELEDSEEHISEAAIADGAPTALRGDLLLLVRGMTLLKDVPVGVLRRSGSFNQDLKCLRPLNGMSSDYLGYVLAASRPRLMAMVDQAGHGTGRLAVDRLLTLPVWKPDEVTQRCVVNLFQCHDKALMLGQKLVKAKRAFRRGLMHALLTGKKRFPQFSNRPWSNSTIGALFEEVRRPVAWDEDQLYTLVSIRRRSGGLFLRERKKGAEIKVKSLHDPRGRYPDFHSPSCARSHLARISVV